jgi:hypothetical protein
MHWRVASYRREKVWVILKRGGWLPSVLCETTEFVSAELAEMDRVSAGGWLGKPGARLQTERVARNVRGGQGGDRSSRNCITDGTGWRERNRGKEESRWEMRVSVSEKSEHLWTT